MAIQLRRGAYTNFDPTKMKPGEVGVVQSGDPIASDGKAAYVAFSAGDVKRLATYDELSGYDADARQAAASAQEANTNVQRIYLLINQQQTAINQAKADAEAAALDAQDTLDSVEASVAAAKAAALQEFSEDAEEVQQELLVEINAKGQQILDITTDANQVAAEALTVAGNAENHMQSLDAKMDDLETALQNVSIDPDDLGLEQDSDTYYVYPTYKGIRSENGIPLASSGGGGGGGGGGEVISATFTCTNTTGWLSTTVRKGVTSCPVSFTWSSVEDGQPTGAGTIRITVGEVVQSTYQIQQGNVTVDLAPYLTTAGAKKIKIRISDEYDQAKTTTFNITAVDLSLSSTFDASAVYSSAIRFPYTPSGGSISKTVYFIVDGVTIGTQVVTTSGYQMSYTIPAQTHGAHSLRVYYEAVINNETVRSDELYYEFIFVEQLNDTVIITSNLNQNTWEQYSSISIPFMVYNPANLTAATVTISANGTVVATLTDVDRTEHTYAYRANNYGPLTITIACGGVTKTLNLNITESDIDVEAVTEDLALYLTSQGRSNLETNPGVWTYGSGSSQIACTFTDFNWVSDGWVADDDGTTVLRVSGDARLTIPYKIFERDFRTTGKTIELEFATRNVLNYDTPILSCMSNNRGLSLTAQKATMKSEQAEISTQYKEDEHVRISFVTQKMAENRLIFVFINGVASGVKQYPTTDDFSQGTPVDISIGSNDCTIDLYNIRIYDNDLTRFQVVNNWIADTQDGAVMLERYSRNNIYDEYGSITAVNLPSYLPYLIISANVLPMTKTDSYTCSITFVNPLYPSKSFTASNVTIKIQGTSSVGYPRKNYKVKHNDGFVMTATGSTTAKYAMFSDSIPVKTFCYKADMASSEGANNVELVRLYNEICPYKTPAQAANSKVRQGIDGFPMVVFWNDLSTNTTQFMGKYNYNNDKSTEEVFGFDSPDESWEIRINRDLLALFKSDDFTSTSTDVITGETTYNWQTVFEPRYPDTDPIYDDKAQLQEFVSWAASTDTTAATNRTLAEAVTYDGVTYTTDSAEYRLAKFKAEAGDYMELESAIFYYIFTELFLMIDSRAKNAFPSFIGSEVSSTS